MVTIANDPVGSGSDLPVSPAPVEAAITGLTIARALETDCLAGATIVAGRGGIGRSVTRVNVMEVPDILPWVQPEELLLTTGYALRNNPDFLTSLIPELAERGLAGLAIKTGRYIDHLPESMARAADALDFPLIELPETAAFDDIIYGVLSSVFHPRMSMLERAEAMLRALVDVVLRGGDLEEVCRRLVANGYLVALVTSLQGEVIAEASVDPLAAQNARAEACFDRAGRFRVKDEHPGMPGARVGSTEGPTRLVARITAGAVDHGRIVVFADRPLSPVDLHLLERSAEVAALVIMKNQAIAAVESKYRADFLRDAIAGTAGPAEQVVRHARSFGWELAGPVTLVVAELDQPFADHAAGGEAAVARAHVQQDRFAEAWIQGCRMRLPKAAVAGSGQEVVAVVQTDPDSSVEEVTRLIADVIRSVRRVGGKISDFSTGISRIIPSVDQLPEAYGQAHRAVSIGRQMHGGQSLIHFDALGVFRLLSLISDSHELRVFVDETLGELANDNSPTSVDLRQTLTALLDSNLNVAETARVLHFHYNTLRYRITKLEKMLGPFMTDPHTRLSIALALRVVQLRRL